MDFFAGLIALALPPLLGVGILRHIGLRRSDDWIGYVGWAYLTGVVGVGVYLTVWMLLDLPLKRTLTIPLLAAAGWLCWRRGAGAGCPHPRGERVPPAGYLLFVGALSFLAMLVIIDANQTAISISDEAHIWSLKAKMLYSAGGMQPEFEQLIPQVMRPEAYWAPIDAWIEAARPTIKDPVVLERLPEFHGVPLYHLDYPLLNPLLQLWTFVCSGQLLQWENRLPVQLCSIALMLVLAGALWQLCGSWGGAALSLVFLPLMGTTDSLHTACADGMVAAGLVLSVEALRRYRGDRRDAWLYLLAVALTLMVWSKHEGVMYLIALGAAVVVSRPFAYARAWRALVLPALALTFTWATNARFGFANDLVSAPNAGEMARLGAVLTFFWERVYTGPLWAGYSELMQNGYLYLAFLALACAAPAAAMCSERRLVTVTILAAMVGQLSVYVMTPHRLVWHLETSADRFSWQVVPVVLLWLGMACREGFRRF